MTNEPNKNVDELLKAYAQKRRQQAGQPLEMHPATRKILQDEVAMLREKSARPSATKPKLLFGLWPRIALGSSLALLVVASVVLLQFRGRQPEPIQVAKHIDAPAAPAAAPALEKAEEPPAQFAAAPVLRRQFARADVADQARPEAELNEFQNILASFRLEQNGHQIRIVDADGSIYEGEIQTTAPTILAKRLAARAAASVGEIGREGEVGTVYSFRVTGTNRRLNQVVVFEGQLIPATRDPRESPLLSLDATKSSVPINEIQGFSGRIQGRATIGGTDELEIDAVPVAP
jgi:hypothetical protein